eukprot:SAG31_NODE_1478_length_8183_cov_5.227992_5_plen_89_part_00
MKPSSSSCSRLSSSFVDWEGASVAVGAGREHNKHQHVEDEAGVGDQPIAGIVWHAVSCHGFFLILILVRGRRVLLPNNAAKQQNEQGF